MGLWTYAEDVKCPTCEADPFEPCVYSWTQLNHRLGRVGQPIKRHGLPYWHNERQYAQAEFEHAYIFGISYYQLENWFRRFGDIFSETE